MGLEHDAMRTARAAYSIQAAPVRPLLIRPNQQQPVRRRNPEREAIRRQLDAILRVHEPSRTAIDVDRLLDAYAGMERELLACYRQYYASSEVSSLGNNYSGVRVQVSPGSATSRPTLQLPRAAVPTFLRAKRQAVVSQSSKADDVRGATVVSPVAPRRRVSLASPTKQSLARGSGNSSSASPEATDNTIDLSATVGGDGLRPVRRPTPALGM
jgi:hypothetical protein